MATKFKIGDKIKVVGNVFWKGRQYNNKLGTITRMNPGAMFLYTISVDTAKIPVGGTEIENVFIKNQQLLFEFMNE